MDALGLWLILSLLLLSSSYLSYSSKPHSIGKGSSLSVEKKDDILISPNGLFTAGFFSVGQNAYCFAIWFTKATYDGKLTIAWMANRDTPVNGKRSKLSLLKTGNLVLQDAGQEIPVWATGTQNSTASILLQLNNTGNLFLQKLDGQVMWQSFDSPTDTLLPNQPFTKYSELVSSRSLTNYSSGFYKLYFDNDNVLRLVYNGPRITSVYWPKPELQAWDAGRSTFISERTAILNSSGYFRSTDALSFYSSDQGDGPQRRLTMDVDGNLRLYSLDQSGRQWQVSWQAISQPCTVHGICGVNSTCTYDHKYGRKCSCLPRHEMINPIDWSYGCKPQFKPTLCGHGEDVFVYLPRVQFYGFEAAYLPNSTLDGCKHKCLTTCNCKGIQYKFDAFKGYYLCYVKFRLFGGHRPINFNGSMYIKLPKSTSSSTYDQKPVQDFSFKCSSQTIIQLDRTYKKKQENGSLQENSSLQQRRRFSTRKRFSTTKQTVG